MHYKTDRIRHISHTSPPEKRGALTGRHKRAYSQHCQLGREELCTQLAVFKRRMPCHASILRLPLQNLPFKFSFFLSFFFFLYRYDTPFLSTYFFGHSAHSQLMRLTLSLQRVTCFQLHTQWGEMHLCSSICEYTRSPSILTPFIRVFVSSSLQFASLPPYQVYAVLRQYFSRVKSSLPQIEIWFLLRRA